ncbi:hypothetical protein DPMN_003265 [Dreissena polymorpha]|uniref:Uncharacterized protein n=1 Tax=Dreissena polymorpha TaxID=45954 RepID=A0A9D4MLI2_DREPO|nr:hypothetical protein DPMN_003265 [Dreissena polymorpha]
MTKSLENPAATNTYHHQQQQSAATQSLKAFANLRGFHDDWAKNVISSVHKLFLLYKYKKTASPVSHVIQLTETIFKLNSHIKETNVLTKFHEHWAKNVTSRKNAPPTGGHIFSPIWTIFEVVRDINKTNVLTNFHDDWAKIVTSRVFTSHVIQLTGTIFELSYQGNKWFTCFHYIHIEKNAPPTGGHVFSPI